MPANPTRSARVELDPRYARALDKVETCTHLILLYWMDRARRDLMVQTPRHYGEGRGTFALRSPVRPNPIALSVVKLVKVEGTTLQCKNIDCLDNTPLLDIKPYFASVDFKPDATVGWHRDRDHLPLVPAKAETQTRTGFPPSRE